MPVKTSVRARVGAGVLILGGQDFVTGPAGEVRHVDPRHGVVGDQAHLIARREGRERLLQLEGRHRTAVATRVDNLHGVILKVRAVQRQSARAG